MRVIFMGTPGFAVPCLDVLVKNGFDIVAVVTAPDRPAGRGQKVKISEVKEYSLKSNLNLLQPANLKSPEFLETLQSLKPDLQVVVAFRMLPKQVWDLPLKGTINLHASLLPNYRGAAPINWAIINGESKTGATTFYINEKIDTGSIIDQVEVKIEPKDTAGTLHDKLMMSGADLLLKTVKEIQQDKVNPKPQELSNNLKEAPKIFKGDTKVDFSQSARDVINLIRGLSPYPAATSTIFENENRIDAKIYNAKLTNVTSKGKVGEIETTKHALLVSCKDYKISIEEIQLAGKKRMKTSQLLNGFKLTNSAKMG
jgi:methionyl-tRNA formyltransferase